MRTRRPLVWWILLAAAGLLAAALWATSAKPPRLPANLDHDPAQPETHCLTCHAATARRPRPADHPLRDDCFSCHRDRDGSLHPRLGALTELPGGWRDDPRLAARARQAARPQ